MFSLKNTQKTILSVETEKFNSALFCDMTIWNLMSAACF